MTDKKWDNIEVLIEGGRKKEVEVECMFGDYAIHPRIVKGEQYGPGYTVTFKPNGMAVWSVAIKGDAYRIAQYLDEKKPQWDTLDEKARARVSSDLENI